MTTSWLCRDGMDRARLLDMEKRIRPVRAAAMLILGVALLVSAPRYGLWTLVPLAIAAALFEGADRRLQESERPEFLMFAAWAGTELTIAVALVLSGGPQEVLLSWLAIPVVTLSARFSLRGVYIGVALALALVVAVALIMDAQAVSDDPTVVIAPSAVVLTVATLSTALMRSDLKYRGQAVLDPLTGMLNRNALSDRVAELSQQSALSGDPVGLVIGDIDGFKPINDQRGHATGDEVLRELSRVLRARLRAFDLVYRIGGEEFLILLPGADASEARAVADALREAVAEEAFLDGLRMTMSFGVAASDRGDSFHYDEVFRRADSAMYEGKRRGGNAVSVGVSVSVSGETAGGGAPSRPPRARARRRGRRTTRRGRIPGPPLPRGARRPSRRQTTPGWSARRSCPGAAPCSRRSRRPTWHRRAPCRARGVRRPLPRRRRAGRAPPPRT